MDYMDRTPFKFRKKRQVNLLMGEDEEEDMDEVSFTATEKESQASRLQESDRLINELKANLDQQYDPKTKIRLVKEKLKRGIKAQISSFKSCAKRRLKFKSYPESAEMIKVGFEALESLCTQSIENKAALFNDDGWYHLERLYRKHPMKALILFQKIFAEDKSLLFQDMTTFERIFKLYRSFVLKIFSKERDSNIPTNDAALIFLWNTVLADILKINCQQVSIQKVMHMFFMVQQIFSEQVADFTFTFIINPKAIIMDEDEKSLKHPFKMIDKHPDELLQLYQENEYFMGADQQIMCMEMAYSFLGLINRASKNLYYGDMLRIAREYFFKRITKDTSNLQHELLFKFKEGLTIRSEIMRFYRIFFVFHSNHLISPDSMAEPWGNPSYDQERMVPYCLTQATLEKDKKKVNFEGEENNEVLEENQLQMNFVRDEPEIDLESDETSRIVNYLLLAIKSSEAVTMTSGNWTSKEADKYVTEYFIKNLFPTIYKYVMGIYKLYHFNREDFQRMADIIKEIGNFLFKNTFKGFNSLRTQFKDNEKIKIIQEALELTKKIFEEFIPSTSLYKIDKQELEDEEINKIGYYKWKRYCVILLSGIEGIYDNLAKEEESLKKLIGKYRRIAYEKESLEDSMIITSDDIDTKYAINLKNFEERNNLTDEGDEEVDIEKVLGEGKNKAKVLDMFRIKYIESKKKLLSLDSNIIQQFMNNSEGHHDMSDTFQEFIESCLKGIPKKGCSVFSSISCFNGFFEHPFYYNLVRIWNNLLCENRDVRDTISQKMADCYTEEFKIENPNGCYYMMQIIYKTYLDLYQYASRSVFYDRAYMDLWDIYFNVGDIIKNVCENNNQQAKQFFSDFGLHLEEPAEPYAIADDADNEYDMSLIKRPTDANGSEISPIRKGTNNIDDSIVKGDVNISGQPIEEAKQEGTPFRLGLPNEGVDFSNKIVEHLKNELFKTLAYVGINGRKADIVRTDHPEMYFTIGRQFDILCELFNGPCKKNQEVLIGDGDDHGFNPRDVEIILNVCRRNITDLNSGYIDIQNKAYLFLLAMFEGDYRDGIDLIAEKLDPNVIFKLMINYTKRLYLQIKIDDQEKLDKLKDKYKGVDSSQGSSDHYKKKKFDVEDSQNKDEGSMVINPKSMRNAAKNPQGNTRLYTYGDEKSGDMGAEDNFNLWTVGASESLRRTLMNEKKGEKLKSVEELLKFYKETPEFCEHQTLELIMKIYSTLRTMESNFKFRGFMKKKEEEMKRHYYMLPNVSALCSNDEIEFFKKSTDDEHNAAVELPEEITIFTFLNDIVRSVEIMNANGDRTIAYYPMIPMVYYLSKKSLDTFRLECRIDQATTKVMDMMAYTKQFKIEMDVNYDMAQNQPLLARFLSDDAFTYFKMGLWLIGFFINILVVEVYEIIDGR